MKIVFSDHAKKQAIERKIAKKYVLETIKNPKTKLKSYKNRQLFQRTFGGKILEVVTIEEGQSLVVITQYWLEQEKL